VTLLKMETSDDSWRRKYRYIRIDGGTGRMENTNIGEDRELGKVNLSNAFDFQLYQRDDDKEPGQVLKQSGWGALELAVKYGKPADGDLSTWTVKRPLDSGGGTLRVRLKFEEPLPEPDQWLKE